MSKWINIFKTGTHTDSSGREKTWTKEHLDTIVSNYGERTEDSPLVLGHPKDSDPAFGWTKALRRAGEFMQAQVAQIPEKLRQAVDTGQYKNLSISITPDMKLRHIGLLGAVPPAVKGLGPLSFSKNDDDVVVEINFNEADSGDMPGGAPNEKDKHMSEERIKELEGQLAEEKKRANDEADGRKKAETDLENKNKEFSESQAKQRKEAITTKIDGLVEKGVIVPADKDRLSAFAEALDSKNEDFCFSEGEGKKPLIDHFWEYLESGDEHGLFQEFAAPKGDDNGTDVDLTDINNYA